jgi:hypothetical protein
MEISYLKRRSKFLAPCVDAISQQRDALLAGKIIRVDLRDAAGWELAVKATISDKDKLSFGTDWKNKDPSFFPARLKAAATALRNCGLNGNFIVEHNNSTVTIRLLSPN